MKTVSVQGITADDDAFMKLIQSDNIETAVAEQNAYDKISRIDAQENCIVLKCYDEKPEVVINIRIGVFG